MENLFKQNVDKTKCKLVASSEKRFGKIICQINHLDRKLKRPRISCKKAIS